MRSPDNKHDIPPAKKAKLEDITPNLQDAAKKAKLEETTPNPEDGTNIDYHEHLEPREYIVLMELEDLREHRKSGEDVMSFFLKVMRDVGCPASKIKPLHTSWHFYADLTPDEVKRLSDLDSVKLVTPANNCRVYHELNQPWW